MKTTASIVFVISILGCLPILAQEAMLSFCKEYREAIFRPEIRIEIEIGSGGPLLTGEHPTVELVFENVGNAPVLIPVLSRQDGIVYEIQSQTNHYLPNGKVIQGYSTTITQSIQPVYSGCSPKMQSLLIGQKVRLRLSHNHDAPWRSSSALATQNVHFSEGKQQVAVYIGGIERSKEFAVMKPRLMKARCIQPQFTEKRFIQQDPCVYLLELEAGGSTYLTVTMSSFSAEGEFNKALDRGDLQKLSEIVARGGAAFITFCKWESGNAEWQSGANRSSTSRKLLKIKGREYTIDELWNEFSMEREKPLK